VKVAFEVLGEPAETGQVGSGSGGFDPLRQLVTVQVQSVLPQQRCSVRGSGVAPVGGGFAGGVGL
jgi:hypothetical protein